MEWEGIWPLFGLEIVTPRLVLKPVSDDDLPGLASAALAGVHDQARMPFSRPWTDADPQDLPRNLAEFHWRLRGRVSPEDWTIAFGVHYEGRLIGSQDLAASGFGQRKTVRTGSWLTQSVQGRGLGTEMRAGMLMFAFDTLGAHWAESGAASWNVASLRVSKKLGYTPNGVTRVAVRPGEATDEQRVRLSRDSFVRPNWALTTRGVEGALHQLGLH